MLRKFILRVLIAILALTLSGCATTLTRTYPPTNLFPEPWPAPGAVETPCLPTTALQRLPAPLERPQHIVLLIPLNGELGWAGMAIAKGFHAANCATSDYCRPQTICVVDTSRFPCIEAAYQAAAARGADFIVGPLGVQNVRRLSESGLDIIPTLSLSYLGPDERGFMDLYQFGLPPVCGETTFLQENARLFALGFDAFRAAYGLNDMMSNQQKVRGITGVLYMNSKHQVMREAYMPAPPPVPCCAPVNNVHSCQKFSFWRRHYWKLR